MLSTMFTSRYDKCSVYVATTIEVSPTSESAALQKRCATRARAYSALVDVESNNLDLEHQRYYI